MGNNDQVQSLHPGDDVLPRHPEAEMATSGAPERRGGPLDTAPAEPPPALGGPDDARRTSETPFRSLVEHSSDIVAILDADNIVRYASPAVEVLLGYRPHELIGTRASAWLHDDDAGVSRLQYARARSEPGNVARFESRVRHRDGSRRSFDVVASNLLDEPSVGGIVVNARDITERKQLEEQLTRQAFYDDLTELPNRALFNVLLTEALTTAVRRHSRVAVVFLDLDGFKSINDSFGHTVGDALLVDVAHRLPTCLRPGDTVARFSVDEFTILLEDVGPPSVATRVAERILAAMQQPFVLDGREAYITTSIGIALSTPSDGPAGMDDLMRAADVALHQAKAAGKARAVVFDASQAMERLDLEKELRRAVESGELRVYHQPEIDLSSGKIVGLEALVRWQHPRRGLMAPSDFIGLAEQTGLIVPLGQWVLRDACRQTQSWKERYFDGQPMTISVNLSARQIAHPDIVAQVDAILEETALDASCLRLEITESVLLDEGPSTETTLRELKALGIQLAIDDFGTGYSSLSYLRRFPVDVLKIDRSFVMALDGDEGTGAIVRAITSLARALGMEVTAEGIETAEQLAQARAIGCGRGQGFYFSPPLPSDAMDELLRNIIG